MLLPYQKKLGLSDAFFELCKEKIGLSNRYLTKEDTSGRYDGIWKLVIPANMYGLINGGVSNDRIQQNRTWEKGKRTRICHTNWNSRSTANGNKNKVQNKHSIWLCTLFLYSDMIAGEAFFLKLVYWAYPK